MEQEIVETVISYNYKIWDPFWEINKNLYQSPNWKYPMVMQNITKHWKKYLSPCIKYSSIKFRLKMLIQFANGANLCCKNSWHNKKKVYLRFGGQVNDIEQLQLN